LVGARKKQGAQRPRHAGSARAQGPSHALGARVLAAIGTMAMSLSDGSAMTARGLARYPALHAEARD